MTIAPPIDDEKAYFIWLESYRHKAADTDISPFLNLAKKRGWLRRVREALLVSTNQAAQRMGVSKTTYIRLERSEASGTINFRSLSRAAAAFDCEIVYALRPKPRMTFSRIIWNRIRTEARLHPWVQSRPAKRKTLALAAAAKWRLQEPPVRRRLTWTERKNNGSA